MGGKQIVVDVREDLRAGREPFRKIMAAADEAAVGDTLVLYATVKPVPLLAVLKAQGFDSRLTRLEGGEWRVDFLRIAGPEHDSHATPPDDGVTPNTQSTVESSARKNHVDIHLDNRGLEPPEPMARTLQAVYRLKKGQRIIGEFDRTPMFLLPKLDEMGFVYEVESHEDGRATVTIQHAD